VASRIHGSRFSIVQLALEACRISAFQAPAVTSALAGVAGCR
jgi:hypothetical protein